MAKKPIKVMISSSVYGAQSLLRQTYGTLKQFGYEVICSPVGSLPVDPNESNRTNCLQAVKGCDIFVGLVRPIYGSGRDTKTGKSITHEELEKAVDLGIPRWVLAHSSVVKMRSLVRHLFYENDGSRKDTEFKPLKGEFDDPRVIEMYDLAADNHSKKPWSQRKNNWVQEYHYDFEALDYLSNQLADTKRVASYLEKGGKTNGNT
ncbi:MAG: DUF4062 domain-containing protein [Puniceicoccaceae bacterium]